MKLENSRYLKLALQASVWADNLKRIAKEKNRSIHKISRECNLVIQELDRQATLAKPIKFAFDKNRAVYKQRDKLKELVYGDSFWLPEHGVRENLCNKLEMWAKHATGLVLPFTPQTKEVFPNIDECIVIGRQKGWLVHDPVSGTHTISKLGRSLPKFKKAINMQANAHEHQRNY